MSSLSSRHLREKTIANTVVPVQENIHTVSLTSSDESAEVIIFDVKEVIEAKLMRSGWGGRAIQAVPSYAQTLKSIYGNQIVTGFLDSPSYEELLLTVPFDQRPPIVFGLYADAIDRDAGTNSSGKNQIHCTYLQVLNTREFGLRKRDDYEIVMLINDKSIKKYSYEACHKKLIRSIKNTINSGIKVNGVLHAVRLAYLQVNFSYTSFEIAF